MLSFAVFLAQFANDSLVKILLLFVEVNQFLVQRLVEQLEILQASLDKGVFLEPILSNAAVVWHIL